MQRALSGSSGTLIGLDYRGVMVLAAFEPVAELNLGLVVKIDLEEIRQPFLNAAIAVIIITLALVLLGTLIVRRIGIPLVQELEENVQRLRGIVDTAADGIITHDADGIIRSFNQAAEKIFGYKAQTVVGKAIHCLEVDPNVYVMHDDEHPVDEQFIGTQCEVMGLHKSGRRVPLEVTISQVKANNVWLITSIVRDITERKQALIVLHQREEELRLIFENAPVGIYICDFDGFILRANHAVCALLKTSEQGLIGQVHTRFLHNEDVQQTVMLIDQLLKDKHDNCTLETHLLEVAR
jgi:PAS domain S-box-containing protein